MSTPGPGEWQPAIERRLLHLTDGALERPRAERDAYLVEGLRDAPDLLPKARALLASCEAAERDEGIFANSAPAFAEPMIREVDSLRAKDEMLARDRVARALAGRYDLHSEIARGGFAVVYRARDVKHARDVAIKVISPDIAASNQRSRFLREVTIAAQLRHPYIVPLIDSGEVDDAPFYVMPFIDGETLRQHLDRIGALPLEETLTIARDVAEALDAAHAAKIVHRDIKPQNILLDGGHALVADFGIAVAIEAAGGDRLTERGIAVGTPAYMSPEQASAHSRVDSRSDVYSLGCVVYEMLAGEVPYPGDTPRSVQAKHLHAPVPDLAILRPALPREVASAVMRALAKNPADRFATAGEFIGTLTKAATSTNAAPQSLATTSGVHPSTGAMYVPRAFNRFAFPALVGALLIGGAFGVWQLARRGSGSPNDSATATAEVDRRRIAVLYFDDLSGNEQSSHIARGLTEDLIDELSQVTGLHVISPNGVRPFRDQVVPVDSIARSLNVGTVVGGSLSVSGSRVRASVRLLDPRRGEQLQSRSFDEASDDVLALRQSVVSQVAVFLRERLGQEIQLRELRAETPSAAAWLNVSKATELVRDGVSATIGSRSDDARDLLNRADSLYAVAQRLDPKWIEPAVGRGWVPLYLAFNGPTGEQAHHQPDSLSESAWPFTMMRRAAATADRILLNFPGNAKALALRGMARERLAIVTPMRRDSLLRAAEADLRAAVSERPDDAKSWYALGELLFWMNRWPEAASALGRAYSADAFLTETRSVISMLFHTNLQLKRTAEAQRWCDLGLRRYAGDPRLTNCQLILLEWSGKTARDLAQTQSLVSTIESSDSLGTFKGQRAFFRLILAAVAARAGRSDAARSFLADAGRTPSESPISAFREDAALVYLLLNQRDSATKMLEAHLREQPSERAFIAQHAWFQPLKGDSAWQAMITPR